VIRFGVEIRRVGINEGASFTGSLTYNSLADFEVDKLDSASYTALQPLARMRKTSYYGYVQDEFKLRPNLTINAGLRYEFYNDFHETMGRDDPFDFQTCGGFCPPSAAFLFPAKLNLTPGLASPGLPTAVTGARSSGSAMESTTKMRSWTIKTSDGQYHSALHAGVRCAIPEPDLSFNSLLATATGILSPKDQVRDRKDTYSQQWTASVQQALPFRLLATISVLGNKGTKYHEPRVYKPD